MNRREAEVGLDQGQTAIRMAACGLLCPVEAYPSLVPVRKVTFLGHCQRKLA